MNNQDYASQKEKRDRAMNYWKDRVIQEFLPPIDAKKREEMEERKAKLQSQNPLTKLLEFKLMRHVTQTAA